MEKFFEEIVDTLKAGNSISLITEETKLNIKNGIWNISEVILKFIEYLKSNYCNDNNSNTFEIITKYLEGRLFLHEMADIIFLNKIIIDQDKREGGQGQFRHNTNESLFDKMFRTIYEFTRSDTNEPKGVCFDFCLFIFALSTARKDKKELYLWNSIENESGENNYVLFGVDNNDKVMVYDPFNGIYLSPDKYNMARHGAKLVRLDLESLLIVNPNLTGFLDGFDNYENILKKFNITIRDYYNEFQLLERQNYYQRLGLTHNATSEEIAKAYKKIAKKYHPDLNQDDSFANKKFQLILEAFECLNDETRRKKYDLKMGFNITPTPKKDNPIIPKPNTQTPNLDSTAILAALLKKFGVSSLAELTLFFSQERNPNVNIPRSPYVTDYITQKKDIDELIYAKNNIYESKRDEPRKYK